MKKYFSIIILFLFLFSFNSCDEAEKLLDVPFNFTVKEDIPVHIVSDSNPAKTQVFKGVDGIPFNQSVVLSIDNSDTHDYLNKIKEVTIKSLTYQLTNYSGNANGIITAQLYAENILLASIDENVKSASDSGKIFKVDNVDVLNQMALKLKNGHQVTAKIVGNASIPMDFKVHIIMDVKVVANPLK